jgi:hypothetical protein
MALEARDAVRHIKFGIKMAENLFCFELKTALLGYSLTDASLIDFRLHLDCQGILLIFADWIT